MADVIERNGRKKQLIAFEANPLHFFYLYQEAAKNDPKHPPLFSKATMLYLRYLEKKAYGPDAHSPGQRLKVARGNISRNIIYFR